MSLAIPVVSFVRDGEEVGRFWPINRDHARDFISWYNSCKRADTNRGPDAPEAILDQVARNPHPWDAWADNCSTEHRCLKFRGIGWRKTIKHTRPDEDLYRPQPTPDDDSLSMMG